MAVGWKSVHKYMILMLVFFLFSNTTSQIINHGSFSLPLQSEKVSNVQRNVGSHWPMGIVMYYLDNQVYDNYIAHRIRMAMNMLESASCVRFKPILVKPNGNGTWIHFTNPQGERNCVHQPQHTSNGEIVIVLGFDCLKSHEILHTLLHAIGFKDEVSHPHRDRYIRVLWNNIQPEYRQLYQVQSNDQLSSKFLVEYDPLSVMHFHDRAFTINGQATLMPLIPGLLISPSSVLSQLDKMRLRLLFDHECNKRKVGDMIDSCKMVLSNKTNKNNITAIVGDKIINDSIIVLVNNDTVEIDSLKNEEDILNGVDPEKGYNSNNVEKDKGYNSNNDKQDKGYNSNNGEPDNKDNSKNGNFNDVETHKEDNINVKDVKKIRGINWT